MSCLLHYIPDHLVTNGRPDIPYFFIDELLYRRCPAAVVDDPFSGISLVDLSVNRSGKTGLFFSYPDDVLYNFNPKKDGEPEKFDESIARLQIKELDGASNYVKVKLVQRELNHGKKKTIDKHFSCICLKHKKIDCNYSHSAFEIYFDGVEVTFDNYRNTIGKHSELRTWCKFELAKMVVKQEIWINWPTHGPTD